MYIYQADHRLHNVQLEMVQSDSQASDREAIDLHLVGSWAVQLLCQITIAPYISGDSICLSEPFWLLQPKPQEHLKPFLKQ